MIFKSTKETHHIIQKVKDLSVKFTKKKQLHFFLSQVQCFELKLKRAIIVIFRIFNSNR